MQFIQAANHFNGRFGQPIKYIIIHGTAGGSSAVDIANYFAQPSTQASAHYVVDQNGVVIQCVAESDAAWANGGISGPAGSTANHSGYGNGLHDPWWTGAVNPNLVSIAIEHVKSASDNSNQLTDVQKQASFNLIRDICNRYNIPKRWADANGGITGHYSMDPVNRQNCPGPYPWDELYSFLGESDMPMSLSDAFAAAHFKDNGNGQWKCKDNGLIVGGAILQFYCQIWGAPRLPQTNEIKNIAGHPEVAIQVYEGGVAVYDPNHVIDNPGGPSWHSCYLMHLDDAIRRGLIGANLDTAAMNTDVQAALKAINDLAGKLK
jgi:N-acetyl-anhydromuramyl-L-alanine amidase AmpD